MPFYGPEMFKIYSIDHYGPEMYEIYKKHLWSCNNWIIQEKLLILEVISTIKLRVLNFGYMMTVNVTIMYINFQMNLQVLLKVTVQVI